MQKYINNLIKERKTMLFDYHVYRRLNAIAIGLCFISGILVSPPVEANELAFIQTSGSFSNFEIVQSISGQSALSGIDYNGDLSSTSSMKISGNFTNFIIDTENASGVTNVGASISVNSMSDFGLTITGSGDHQATLDFTASKLSSNIVLSGAGQKIINSKINTAGGDASQKIQMFGGPLEATVEQAGISLVSNLYSSGTGATVFVLQSEGSSLNLNGYLDSNSSLQLIQSATYASYDVEIDLAANASLILLQSTDNLVRSDTGDFSISVGENTSLTITR